MAEMCSVICNISNLISCQLVQCLKHESLRTLRNFSFVFSLQDSIFPTMHLVASNAPPPWLAHVPKSGRQLALESLLPLRDRLIIVTFRF